MRIRLTLEDGTEIAHNVANASVLLDDKWEIQFRPSTIADRLTLHSPSAAGDDFPSFVVYHRCANTMDVELSIHEKPNGSADSD